MASVREVFNIAVPALGHIPAREQPCLLCGRREIMPLNAFVLNNQRFHTVRCIHDGMMWLDPQPTEQFYQELYGKYYHTAKPDDPRCVNRMTEQNIPAYCCTLLEYTGEAEPFDVIAMYSVIEHVLDPAAYLKKALALSKTGGILVLRLPDTEAEGPP